MNSSKPSLKEKLRNKALTVGSWLSVASPDGAEILARAGFEFLVIDMEHTGTSMSDMLRLIQVIDLAGATPLVRVGVNDSLLIKRALDCGAHGVIVPMVSTAEQARIAIASAYYPPTGQRGVGMFRAQGYGISFDAYREWAAKETVVIVQIEHHLGVRNLPDIVAVEGVDGFILGPYDLSGSVGKPGQFDDPEVKRVFADAAQALKRSPKPGGLHVVDPAEAKLAEAIEAGYRFIALGVDQVFLSQAAGGAIATARRLAARAKDLTR